MSKNKSLVIVLLSAAVVFSLVLIAANSTIAKAEKNQNQGQNINTVGQENQKQNQEGIGNIDNSSLTVTNTSSETGTTTGEENGVGPNGNNEKGQLNAQQHRSVVANFVQSLLQVADREGGIGKQVRIIAQQQNQSVTTTIQAMDKVQTRSKIKTFLFGSDYKNLGALRSEMVQTRNRIDQLNRILGNIQNATDTAEIQAQMQTLEQEQTKIENFIKAQENKISLFGWFVKLFNK